MPGVADRLAQQRQQQSAGAGADPNGTAAAEDGALSWLLQEPTSLPSSAPAFVANMFGPACDVAHLMDPYGSAGEPQRNSGSSGAHHLGTQLLQALLGGTSLSLRLRPEPQGVSVPDPAEEALTDMRVGTWREVVMVEEEARAREVVLAQRAAAVAASQAEQAAWLNQQQQPPPCEGQDWSQHEHQHQQQQHQQQPWPQQGANQQQSQQPLAQPHPLPEVQQEWGQEWPRWHSSYASSEGLEGGSWDVGPDGGADNAMDWMACVPSAPRRDDAAEVTRGDGEHLGVAGLPASPTSSSPRLLRLARPLRRL
jgi:hypothetical protein